MTRTGTLVSPKCLKVSLYVSLESKFLAIVGTLKSARIISLNKPLGLFAAMSSTSETSVFLKIV